MYLFSFIFYYLANEYLIYCHVDRRALKKYHAFWISLLDPAIVFFYSVYSSFCYFEGVIQIFVQLIIARAK